MGLNRVHGERHPLVGAAAWMTGALLSLSAMAIAVRELSATLGTLQILAVRSLIGLLIMALLLTHTGWNQVSLRHWRTHLARNLVHFGGQFGWYHAIAFLPLAAVFALEFTVPLWTAIFAAVLLGERLFASRVGSVLLGLAGVGVILRPGWSVVHPAALVMLGGALAFGLSHVLTRKLAVVATPQCVLFFMMLVQLPLALVPAALAWAPITLAHWPWLTIVSLTGLSAHYCMVRALALADATVVVPLDFLRLPLIAVIGYAVYGEHIDLFLTLGAGLILVANYINLRRERQRKAPLSAASERIRPRRR